MYYDSIYQNITMHLFMIVSSPNFFTVFVAALAATLFFFLAGKLRHNKSSNLPPGSFGWPLLGETLDFLRTAENIMDDTFIRSRMEKYDNRAFKTSLFGSPVACFCGPAGNKFLFTNENKVLTVSRPTSVSKIVGQSLLSKVGEEGKWSRRMIMAFFSPETLHRSIATIDMVAQKLLEKNWGGQNEVQVYPLIKQFTFEMSCRLLLSMDDPETMSKLYNKFNVINKGIISLAINFPGTRFSRALGQANVVRAELKEMIKHREIELENKTASPTQDLLSHLIANPDETGQFMPKSEIANNILALLIANQDATSSNITMLMKYLSELPEVYEEVLKEQMDIAMAKEPGESLNWEDIKKMRYSGNVISEVMRVYLPISGAFREAIVDFNYAGYTIPKGWKLMWSNMPHNDPTIFPDPMKFDPSRFERDGPNPFTYVPFGGGPRMCLGKDYARIQILVFLHNVVKRFKWEPVYHDEKIQIDPMPVPSKGFPVRLRPLQS